MEPRPEARPPSHGPSRMPDRAHMMLPRWKEVVPAMERGIVMRRAEPAAVNEAIIAANTIFLVVKV